jgi:hypothetical protein
LLLLQFYNWILGYQVCCGSSTRGAANEMFVAQQNFQKLDGVASDSLYKLSLNGSEGKFGFLKLPMNILELMQEFINNMLELLI